MEKMIAYCGLVCTDCGAYIAMKTDDDELRKTTAEIWTKKHNHPFKPEDINCEGCLTTTGKVINWCTMCPVRKCGQEKGVENCGWCDAYPCDKIEDFFKTAPDCKKTLDAEMQSRH